MIVRFSTKVDELWKRISPYIEEGAHLKSDAPEHIKKTYKELMDLMDKEYEEASF